MAMLRPLRRVPRPPPVRPAEAPELVGDSLRDGWRLHWEPDPRKPNVHPKGKFRFDAPEGQYSVAYVNGDPKGYGCFAEAYGDQRSIAPNQAQRHLSSLSATTPLKVMGLDDGKTLAALKLDLDISASVDYERTMLWSKSIHDWYEDVDGIRYLGRHATKKLNYCLFLDRCSGKLEFETLGQLGDLRDHVLRAADTYSLAPRLFDSRDSGFPL